MDKKVRDQLREDALFLDFIDDLDQRLMAEVVKPSPVYWAVFQYFDSAPWKPLNPRELLQFWGTLSEDEKLEVLHGIV